MRTLLPFAIALGLMGSSPGLCQTAGKTISKSDTRPAGPADPVRIYQLFFERISHSKPAAPFSFRSDLTDAEMATLNGVAADCDTSLQPLNDRPVVLEARVRSLETGKDQEQWMDERLTELKARRDRVIVDHVETLRTSLGEPRFRALEAFMRAWYNGLAEVTATGTGAAPLPRQGGR